MKRCPLKRKTPLRAKKKLRKETKMPIGKVQKKLWSLCKDIIRIKYGNSCYICGHTDLKGSNWHTAHLIPKAACGAYLKYDLRNLRPSCYHCNINLGGNGALFFQKVRELEGEEYVMKLFNDREVMVKAHDHYLSLIPQYELILKNLHDQTK